MQLLINLELKDDFVALDRIDFNINSKLMK